MSWALHFALHCALAAAAYGAMRGLGDDSPLPWFAAAIVMMVTGGYWL